MQNSKEQRESETYATSLGGANNDANHGLSSTQIIERNYLVNQYSTINMEIRQVGHNKDYGKMLPNTGDAQDGTSCRTKSGKIISMHGTGVVGKDGKL